MLIKQPGNHITFHNLCERVDVSHNPIPDHRFVINPKQLLLPLDPLCGLNWDQPVPSFCMLTHQDPAFLQITAALVLLQLLL